MKKRGFTLAEILITLGVIGVIAAITLTTLIKNYQKTQTVNRLKGTYTTLQQAFNRAISEHDAPVNWIYDDNNLDLFVENYLAPYVKIISKSSNGPKHYWMSDGEMGPSYYKNRNHFYLANGVELTLSPYSTTHYFIIADINGAKGPNTMGKDCFRFQFSKDTNRLSVSKSFTLQGINENISNIKSNCKSLGTFCGAWIMLEGWKIPDDYPW